MGHLCVQRLGKNLYFVGKNANETEHKYIINRSCLLAGKHAEY